MPVTRTRVRRNSAAPRLGMYPGVILRQPPNSVLDLVVHEEVQEITEKHGEIPEIPERPIAPGKKVSSVSNSFAKFLPKRYVLIVLGFIGVVNQYTMLSSLSVAIVAMTNFTPPAAGNATVCTRPSAMSEVKENQMHYIQSPVFPWDTVTQGSVLAAYFYGYLFTLLPSGWIARRYGGKYVFGLGIAVAGLVDIIIPTATELAGANAIIALRVIEGLGSGCVYPAMMQLLSQWSPARERTRSSVIVFTGAPLGSVVSLVFSGYIGDRLGWQWIFRIFGMWGCGWFILWVYFTSSSPTEHPTITSLEKALILVSDIKPSGKGYKGKLKAKNSAVPWMDMLLSPAVWALLIGQIGHNWGNFTMLTSLPLYMNHIQQVQLSKNGLFSALPYVLLAILGVLGACLSDFLIQRKLTSTTIARKLFQTVGNLIPAVCIIGVGYVGCDWAAAVALFTVGTGFSGLTASGFQVNFQDLAPVYASVLFGVTTTITAGLAILLPPVVVGAITASGQTEWNWRMIFYISGGIRLATTVFFDVFASGEPAAWNFCRNRLPSVWQSTVETRVSFQKEDDLRAVSAVRNRPRRHTIAFF